MIPSIISIGTLLVWKVLHSLRCTSICAPLATSGVLSLLVRVLSRLRHRLTTRTRLLERAVTNVCMMLAPMLVVVVSWHSLLGLVMVQATWLDLGRSIWIL